MRRLTHCLLVVLMIVAVPTNAAEFSLDAMTVDDPFASLSFSSGVALKEQPLLQAKLVPEYSRLSPEQPIKVLVELDHLPGSYTYWTNPGGPGVGSTIIWDLPPGFTISEPSWSAPQLYHNGSITSYILKGKTAAVFTVTPPRDLKAGDVVTLSGTLDTQVCTSKTCNPLTLPLSLDLAVAARPGEANPAIAKAENQLPRNPQSWRFEVSEFENELIIAMHPSPGSNPELEGIYYFDKADPIAQVDSQKPQEVEKDDGGWWLRIPRTEGHSLVGSEISGILYAANGWVEGQPEITSFSISQLIKDESSGGPPGLSIAIYRRKVWLLFFAFIGGLLLNIMPCVFPVIGLKIMGFAKQAHKERRAVFLHGLAYTAGVLLCFWTLSFLVITMGRGWGAQLQSEWFVFILCHIFMIMSMNMAGVFEVGASVANTTQALTGREGIKRSFLTGLLATITSTPCSAPFLGTALAYALSLPAVLSLGVFTLMGLGFSLPYLALSLFPGWLKRLPKPGPWMDTFKQAMSFPLFATTAYMFWTMEAMFDEWQFLMLLFGLVLTAMACWLYGKMQHSRIRSRTRSRVLLGASLAAFACGVWLGFPSIGEEKIEWKEWSPEMVSRLREEGRPVFVDFTARWCATCQLNKRVYQDAELMDLLVDKNVALLKADWTQYDDRITSTLKNEFNKAAVPVTVLYVPGQRRASILPEILTVGNVTEKLRAIP